MNRYYIVKEYIYYYMHKRRFTPDEFCRICEIEIDEYYKIIKNDENFDMATLEKISKYIYVPMEHLYIDLEAPNFKPIVDRYEESLMERNKPPLIIF